MRLSWIDWDLFLAFVIEELNLFGVFQDLYFFSFKSNNKNKKDGREKKKNVTCNYSTVLQEQSSQQCIYKRLQDVP